jgi:hypothetical protein
MLDADACIVSDFNSNYDQPKLTYSTYNGYYNIIFLGKTVFCIP